MKEDVIQEKAKRALLQFGLTEKEIAVYLILLEKGASSIQEISRESGINRVTIYAAADELKRKGLIAETKKGKRSFLVAEDPENLQDILENKKELLKKEENTLNNLILPTLKAININQKNKPQIWFFEGTEGINRVYDNYALKHKDIIGCGSYETALKATSWEYEEKYLKEIKNRNIFYRVILKDTPTDRKFSETFRGYFHTKFMNLETELAADIHVFGDYVSLMSYDSMTTTLIKDEAIVKSIKIYLEFMWERL